MDSNYSVVKNMFTCASLVSEPYVKTSRVPLVGVRVVNRQLEIVGTDGKIAVRMRAKNAQISDNFTALTSVYTAFDARDCLRALAKQEKSVYIVAYLDSFQVIEPSGYVVRGTFPSQQNMYPVDGVFAAAAKKGATAWRKNMVQEFSANAASFDVDGFCTFAKVAKLLKLKQFSVIAAQEVGQPNRMVGESDDIFFEGISTPYFSISSGSFSSFTSFWFEDSPFAAAKAAE